MNGTINHDAHEWARQLIALTGSEAVSEGNRRSAQTSNEWLAAHLEGCDSCRAFAENSTEIIRGLRGIPIAADRSLVWQTQMKVSRRALELRRDRERLLLVSVSCTAVTLSTLLSVFAWYRGFAWLGEKIHLTSPVWQACFLVFCILPALVAALLMWLRDTHLADHTGSYQG